MAEHEVIIVGGGPAGAAAAWELVRNGVDCLVVDREPFPREKLCAGWITPEVLRDLEFQQEDYPFRFLTFETLRISLKGLKFSYHAAQHSIRRFEFDRWLIERSGAPLIHHRVREVERLDGGFLLDDAFRCRFLIGAGGTRCPVYRNLFKDSHPRARELQVVTQELEFPCEVRSRDCHLQFFRHGLPGYSWYVPKQDGYLNVGVGGVAARIKSGEVDIKQHWRYLIDDLVAADLLAGDPGQPGGYSYYLRPGRPEPRLGNAFVVGDAAGLATRDMCEGIGPAVQSGLMAARAILKKTDFDLSRIASRTLGQPMAARSLDWALTRSASAETG
jgi:flavin-dependent dehydrogenase